MTTSLEQQVFLVMFLSQIRIMGQQYLQFMQGY